MSIPVVGLGAGGHARVMIEILNQNPRYEIIGLLDFQKALHGKEILGVQILGDDSLVPSLVARGILHFFIGLGSTGNTNPRRKLYEFACYHKMTPVNAIHPKATISPSARFGLGFAAMANSVVNACATIGENVILNTGAIIEHDCVVGSHVYIGSGAKLGSGVQVGNGSHIGLGATIRQGVVIAESSIIDIGEIILREKFSNG